MVVVQLDTSRRVRVRYTFHAKNRISLNSVLPVLKASRLVPLSDRIANRLVLAVENKSFLYFFFFAFYLSLFHIVALSYKTIVRIYCRSETHQLLWVIMNSFDTTQSSIAIATFTLFDVSNRKIVEKKDSFCCGVPCMPILTLIISTVMGSGTSIALGLFGFIIFFL